jgi:hypothetical protein
MGEKRITYTILMGKPKGNRPLGRSRCECEGNIKKNHKVISVWNGFNWLRIAAVVGSYEHCNEFSGSIK